jgi:hypothetical protein
MNYNKQQVTTYTVELSQAEVDIIRCALGATNAKHYKTADIITEVFSGFSKIANTSGLDYLGQGITITKEIK